MPKPGPTDTVPALLTPGEHVMNREAVAILGADTLAKANREGLKMRNQTQGYVDGGRVNQPLAATGILNPAVKPVEFNANNAIKGFLGDSGVQSEIGAAVKPISTGALQNTSQIGAPLQTSSAPAFADTGFNKGTTCQSGVKGIFAGQDQLAKMKMFSNSKPSQIGNISALENTDLQGFADGTEDEDGIKPKRFEEAGVVGFPGFGGKKAAPTGHTYDEAGVVGFPDVSGGIKSTGAYLAEKAKEGYGALTKAMESSPSGGAAKADTAIPKSEKPIAVQPSVEKMLPGASNYAGFGDKGYITSANQAGIRRVNDMVARGGLTTPERAARFAQDAADTEARFAKYGDGKEKVVEQAPQQPQIPVQQGRDYTEAIAESLDQLNETPLSNSIDALIADKKKKANARARLGILQALQREGLDQNAENARIQAQQNQFLQNIGLKEKELGINRAKTAAEAATATEAAHYKRGRDVVADAFKERELDKGNYGVIKTMSAPTKESPLGTEKLVRFDKSTGKILNEGEEGRKIIPAPKEALDALKENPDKIDEFEEMFGYRP